MSDFWVSPSPSMVMIESSGTNSIAVGSRYLDKMNRATRLQELATPGRAGRRSGLAEAVLVLAAEHEFAQRAAQGMIFQGWALAEQGHATEGVARMRQGLAAWRETGVEVNRSFFLALLAAGYQRTRQVAPGLPLVDEALVLVEATGERWCEAELHHLRGELILSEAADQAPEAEACFRHALTIARSQHAKSWELRAAMSLSRLWGQQGKRDAAHELLAEVYGWFTEGSDTPDLQEAQGLLKAWGRREVSREEGAAQ